MIFYSQGVATHSKLSAVPIGGVVIANMVGSVRNTLKALDAGVDVIIAQGTEGGGHTGHLDRDLGNGRGPRRI